MDDEFTDDFTVTMHSQKHGAPLWLKIYISQAYFADSKRIIVTMIDVTGRDKRHKDKLVAIENAIAELSRDPLNYLEQVTDTFEVGLSA